MASAVATISDKNFSPSGVKLTMDIAYFGSDVPGNFWHTTIDVSVSLATPLATFLANAAGTIRTDAVNNKGFTIPPLSILLEGITV